MITILSYQVNIPMKCYCGGTSYCSGHVVENGGNYISDCSCCTAELEKDNP